MTIPVFGKEGAAFTVRALVEWRWEVRRTVNRHLLSNKTWLPSHVTYMIQSACHFFSWSVRADPLLLRALNAHSVGRADLVYHP
jgi:hypothetical protein